MDKDPGQDLEYYVAARVDEALNGAEEAPGVVRVEAKKHPRLRAWAGLFALLLGFALVAGSLLSGLGQWVLGSDQEWWKGDWQETASFQYLVSGYVRDFLTLGAGGTLTWYDTVLEGDSGWTDGGWWGEPTSDTAMEDPGYTAPDAAYQADKNVLYGIYRGSALRYSNTDQALAYASGLPEGYNFLLIFRDGRAQAWKDGEEIDLYGDGVYTVSARLRELHRRGRRGERGGPPGGPGDAHPLPPGPVRQRLCLRRQPHVRPV